MGSESVKRIPREEARKNLEKYATGFLKKFKNKPAFYYH
jgi:hypothetical protein